MKLEDTTIGWRFINPLMKAQYGVDAMPQTADNVADDYKVSRADQDAFALRSLLLSLAPHADDVVTGEQPFTLKLPNLWHLASDVRGRLTDGSSSLDLIAALHPTAAVCGTSTPVANDLIRALEGMDRARYAIRIR